MSVGKTLGWMWKRKIDDEQAKTALLEEILGGLPKKRNTEIGENDIGNLEQIRGKSYNQALKDCEQVIRGMFK